MSDRFTTSEWRRIFRLFETAPEWLGLPERVYGSAVLASFNLRKLGAEQRRDDSTWRFLGDVCRHFDLLAVQEVLDDLSGLRRLRREMGPQYRLIVSDTTGAFPGERGLNERLAFIYRDDLVERADIVSDVTYDRSKILSILSQHAPEASRTLADHRAALESAAAAGGRAPKLDLPFFLAFIRQPYAVGFRILGHPGVRPYELMAINAHLIFGKLRDRKREFRALMDWILERERQGGESELPGMVLMGDLNLDFNDPRRDFEDLRGFLRPIRDRAGREIRVAFPFLEPHPARGRVLRTNARLKETFDHIGLFYPADRVPPAVAARRFGDHPRGPDFGVVQFVDLFSRALLERPFEEVGEDDRRAFYPRFEHEVSDHLPIWFRLPLPDPPPVPG